MMKIQDAPYIREAETIGCEEPDANLHDMAYFLYYTRDHLSKAYNVACDAAAYAEGTEYELKVKKILDAIEDLECDCREIYKGYF